MPATPRIVRTPRELRSAMAELGPGSLALTPTMGALHQGHLSLVAIARAAADRVAATIFVNPTQFGPGEDFAAYPRDEARDLEMLGKAGCDLVYAPAPETMYPAGFATSVRVSGLSEPLCGADRPGHFDGVALVVAKLLAQTRPDVAVFGEKDWQQLAIIRRVVADLDLGVRILGAPIVRDADGLALSSRNAYLTAAERNAAPALHRSILAAAAEIAADADPDVACAAAAEAIRSAGFQEPDYVEARTADGLAPLAPADRRPGRVFAAARLGRARLIDNVPIEGGE